MSPPAPRPAGPGPRIVRMLVPAADVELAADALWQGRPSAVHEEPLADRVRLTADPVDLAPLQGLGDRWPTEVLELDSDDHLDAWRAWAKPIRAGRRILLQPDWLPAAPAPDDIVVSLDPGRTFGSGSHPSTRLVLGILEDRVRAGDEVLDVGTGSGVLAVAACLLGARTAVGIDIDPAAVDVTRANAVANGVDGMVSASTRPLAEVAGEFDVVLANIGARILSELAEDLLRRTRPGGWLALAGLLAGQVDSVVARFVAVGAVLVEQRDEEGWAAVVLEPVSQAS